MVDELTPRDLRVVALVGGLGQAASTHVRTLLFSDRDPKVMYRSLERLMRGRYLLKLGRRAPGLKGGNTPAVYQLGSVGWLYMEKRGKYSGSHKVDEHALLIADLFVELSLMDSAGHLRLLRLEPELRRERIITDLFVDVEIDAIKKHRRYYVEVQRNGRADVIPRKLRAYHDALDGYDPARHGIWPYLVFVVYDDVHARDIRRQVPADMRQWVRVQSPDEFVAAITTV